MAGLTVVINSVEAIGDSKEVIATATFDDSYLNAGSGSHGEVLTGAMLKLELALDYVEPIGLLTTADTDVAYIVHYNVSNTELQAWKANGTTSIIPVASGVDLSTYSVVLRCRGKGSAAA